MRHRILVVDDNRLIADTLKLIFNANGFESEAAYSAAEGLARARTFAPCLMLCDVNMPEESGFQLAEKMHAELPACKMLMLTADSSNFDHPDLREIRANRPLKLLKKPCRPEILLSEASALLMSA
jgi:DNA-binding response OmpR family regulator